MGSLFLEAFHNFQLQNNKNYVKIYTRQYGQFHKNARYYKAFDNV